MSFIEPTCAYCTVGSYALLSVCPSVTKFDENSYIILELIATICVWTHHPFKFIFSNNITNYHILDPYTHTCFLAKVQVIIHKVYQYLKQNRSLYGSQWAPGYIVFIR